MSAHAQPANDPSARVMYVGHDTQDLALLEYRRALSEQIVRKVPTEPNLSKGATYGLATAIVTIGADGNIVGVHVAMAPSSARAKQTEDLIRNSGPLAPFPPELRARADQMVLLVELNFSK